MVYFSTLRCASDVDDTYGQAIAYEGTGSSLLRSGGQNSTAYYCTLWRDRRPGRTPDASVVPIPTYEVTLNVKPATQVFGKPIKSAAR